MELKNKSLFKQECFIGGKWVKSLNEETLAVDNPASQETIGVVPKCGVEETKQAIENLDSIYNVGDNIESKILSIDVKDQKISLGIKQLTDDPWINVDKYFETGNNYDCEVFAITDQGVYLSMNEYNFFSIITKVFSIK